MKEYLKKKDIVFDGIRQKILSGEYPPEYKFPSELLMAKELGVGRITLRSALGRLEQAGLIVRVNGKGTFVNSEEERSRDKKLILILMESSSNSLESPSNYIIPAFQQACERLNIQTDSMEINFLRAANDKDVVKRLKENNYYGVLLTGSYYNGDEKELSILRKLNIPVLIPHARKEDYYTTGFAVMFSDQKKYWREGVEHLVRQGHSRLATLGTISINGQKKLRGFSETEYLRFLAKLGADHDRKLLKYVSHNYEAVYAAVKELTSMPDSPTAIMCYSDFVALDVYKSLEKLGYRIPGNIAVMGYCGYPGDHLLSPPLSTIDLQYSDIGKMAAKILYRADEWFAKKDVAVPQIITPSKFVARQSTEIKRMEKQFILTT